MATVSFKIYPTSKDKKTTIFVVLRVNQALRPEVNTGEHVLPQHWGNGRVKGGPDKIEINLHLNQIEKDLLQMWRENKSASREEFKILAKKTVQGENAVQKKTIDSETLVLTWIKAFIEGSKVKAPTKQVYTSSLTHLKSFSDKYNIGQTWESFDHEFYDRFTTYLWDECDMNDNTNGKVIKTLKTFLSESFERDEHTNLNFKKKWFRVWSAEVDEIYLSEKEIEKFYNADLSDRPELVKSKKMFVFGCWVGLRFSDLLKLNPNHALNSLSGPVLKITTTKTGEDVTIPFHPIAKEIWDSWNGYPPKQNNPNFNQDIKEIAKIAGLDQVIQKRNTIKGVVTIEWVPQHTKVKSHVCRRSFATNCYLMGIPVKTIMMVTGHKTEKNFKKYIRISKETHAGIMAGYFNRSSEESVMKKAQ